MRANLLTITSVAEWHKFSPYFVDKLFQIREMPTVIIGKSEKLWIFQQEGENADVATGHISLLFGTI